MEDKITKHNPTKRMRVNNSTPSASRIESKYSITYNLLNIKHDAANDKCILDGNPKKYVKQIPTTEIRVTKISTQAKGIFFVTENISKFICTQKDNHHIKLPSARNPSITKML
jgi:hypothetical protein